jgi:hypothetical protein
MLRLVILLAVIVLVVWLMGSLPGHVGATTRTPLCRGGERGGLDHPDLRLRAVAGCPDLGLRRRAGEANGGASPMMIALMTLYVALLFTLVWLGLIRFTAFWKASPLIVLLGSS